MLNYSIEELLKMLYNYPTNFRAMKKFKFLTQVLFLVLLFAFANCDNSVTSEYRYEKLSVIDVKDIAVTGNQVSMKLTVSIRELCWEFNNTKVEQSAEETIVTVIGKAESLFCQPAFSSFETDFTLTFDSPGEKLIRFWQWNDEFLEVKINIP